VAGAMDDLLHHDAPRIALLKAVGANEGTLLGEYLQIASVLGAIGAIPGVLGGWAATSFVNQAAAAGSAQLLFTPSLGASVFFFVTLTAMAAALAPVSHAVRQDVTPALYSVAQEPLQPGTCSVVPGSVQYGGSGS
jgi:ABC-type antimicrobial peptide transport system permease subunit